MDSARTAAPFALPLVARVTCASLCHIPRGYLSGHCDVRRCKYSRELPLHLPPSSCLPYFSRPHLSLFPSLLSERPPSNGAVAWWPSASLPHDSLSLSLLFLTCTPCLLYPCPAERSPWEDLPVIELCRDGDLFNSLIASGSMPASVRPNSVPHPRALPAFSVPYRSST